MTDRVGTRPNVVMILSDDQGAWAMGCSGNKEICTPNLDRLAKSGIRFENYFCTSPVCSPARASLLTGKIPSQHGVHDWISDGNSGENPIEYLHGQTAYTDILARNGYVCGISGKWHLGNSCKTQKSFSHWYVHESGSGPYYQAPMIRDGKCFKEGRYITDAITEDALCFLDAYGGGNAPFYLSVHYTAPHSPWIGQHPEEITVIYDECRFETCPQEPQHPWSKNSELMKMVKKDIHANLKGYFSAITAMDLNIGRILDRVEKLGIRESTLICFMSDNGFNCGHHGFWGKGNGTYPMNMFDTSVKVPAIFSHPGKIPASGVSDELLSGYDFMPTLLAYAAIEAPKTEDLPGKSFLPVLIGEHKNIHESIVVFDEYGPVRMIRSKEWKYIHRYPCGPYELYDLRNDPEERNNLIDADSKKDILIYMRGRLEDWFCRYSDPEMDGTREDVRGNGQLLSLGREKKGGRAFL